MYMIKCIRNEFCFEYINIYIKNEFFVKIEFFIGKKNFLILYCDKKFENWEKSYLRVLFWYIIFELEIKIMIIGYFYLISSLCVE